MTFDSSSEVPLASPTPVHVEGLLTINEYELVLILRPGLDEAVTGEILTKLETVITDSLRQPQHFLYLHLSGDQDLALLQ